MSRYVVTSNSYFEPFSYDEMVKPIAQMTEAQNAAQEAYDQLSMGTEALRNYISYDGADDAEARAMYNNYMAQLQTLQNNLWDRGFNTSTRRDLAAARSAYSRDITRLASAVEARQQRSDAYWKAKHDNPDMVMGADPGAAGLDYYLRDANYGKNWYQYSGDQFAKEVAADAGARVGEMLRNPDIIRDPRLQGYIMQIQHNGFTNREVNNAGAAVLSSLQGDDSLMEQLTPTEQIAADVLLSHLDSTGAAGNVTPDEFRRLFDYGMTGLSSLVGKDSIQNLRDLVWEEEQQKRLWDYQHPTPTGGGSGDDEEGDNTYKFDTVSIPTEGPQAREINKTLNKAMSPYKDGPVHLVSPSGIPVDAANLSDGSNVLSRMGWDAIYDAFGIDPLLLMQSNPGHNDKNWRNTETTIDLGGDKKLTVSYGYPENKEEYAALGSPTTWQASPIAVRVKGADGKFRFDEELSKEFNMQFDAFKSEYNRWQEANPDVKLDKLALVGKTGEKIRFKNNIPNEVPAQDIPRFLEIKSNQGRWTPMVVIPEGAEYAKEREGVADMMISRVAEIGNRASKGDPIGYTMDGKPITSLATILGRKSSGEYDNGAIISVKSTPETYKTGEVLVTAMGGTTKSKSGTNKREPQVFRVKADYIGDFIANGVDKWSGANGLMETLYKPIEHPEWAYTAPIEEITNWRELANYYLGNFMDFSELMPIDVVRYPQVEELFRDALARATTSDMRSIKDDANRHTMTTLSTSGDKRTNYSGGR